MTLLRMEVASALGGQEQFEHLLFPLLGVLRIYLDVVL